MWALLSRYRTNGFTELLSLNCFLKLALAELTLDATSTELSGVTEAESCVVAGTLLGGSDGDDQLLEQSGRGSDLPDGGPGDGGVVGDPTPAGYQG